jgi:chemotaxis signal transduction protein
MEKVMNEQSSTGGSYILFDVAGTSYGVSSRSVQQVEMIEHITPLPNASAFVEGVVFTRGQVIPAMNLRVRFGFEKVPHTTRTRLIVTNLNGRTVGLIVDSAREFMSIRDEAIQPKPQSLNEMSGRYLKGTVTIGERIVLIVDLDELINVGEGRVPELELHGGGTV